MQAHRKNALLPGAGVYLALAGLIGVLLVAVEWVLPPGAEKTAETPTRESTKLASETVPSATAKLPETSTRPESPPPPTPPLPLPQPPLLQPPTSPELPLAQRAPAPVLSPGTGVSATVAPIEWKPPEGLTGDSSLMLAALYPFGVSFSEPRWEPVSWLPLPRESAPVFRRFSQIAGPWASGQLTSCSACFSLNLAKRPIPGYLELLRKSRYPSAFFSGGSPITDFSQAVSLHDWMDEGFLFNTAEDSIGGPVLDLPQYAVFEQEPPLLDWNLSSDPLLLRDPAQATRTTITPVVLSLLHPIHISDWETFRPVFSVGAGFLRQTVEAGGEAQSEVLPMLRAGFGAEWEPLERVFFRIRYEYSRLPVESSLNPGLPEREHAIQTGVEIKF